MQKRCLFKDAKTWAAIGFPVFPLDGKKPIKDGGFYTASTDRIKIVEWWENGAASWNIGIPTGTMSGLAVIDIDNKSNGPNGFEALAELETLYGALPETVMQRTGYGLHYLFRSPNQPFRCSVGALGPGIDTRGDGGYILVPPSIHPDTGASYDWLSGHAPWEIALAEIPEWVLDRLKHDFPGSNQPAACVHSSSRYGGAALAGECAKIEAAPNGAQERTLNNAAFAMGQLVAAGLLVEAEAIERLRASALKMVSYDPRRPWKPCDIDLKIRRGVSQGKNKPRKGIITERKIC